MPGIDKRFLIVSSNGWVRNQRGRPNKLGLRSLGKPHKGTLRSEGDRRIQVNWKHRLVHDLVAEAFLPAPPSEKHTTVDHIDQNQDNNCVANLRWATRSEQKTNQCTVKKPQRTARAVIVKNGESEERYLSVAQAADALGVNSATCAHAAKSGKPINGCTIRYDDRDQGDVPGEVWKVALGDETLRVSNRGRLRRFNKVSKKWAQKITPEGNTRCGGYCMVKVALKSWLVHRLVATVFLGLPTDPLKRTVDHINRIRTDNRVENLCWATRPQQRANQVRG